MSKPEETTDGDEGRIVEFYDAIAGEYDAMTGFDKRFVEEKPFFRLLLERYKIARALDAGCGTGFHSLLLAQLGARVVAADVSPEMIRTLKERAEAVQAEIEPVASDFAELERNVKGRFNAVFSMGNTLAHMLTRDELKKTLQSFFRLLENDGILFVQLLNYDRILAQRQRVLGVRQSGETIFVRFYDYETDRIQFNILKLRQSGQGFTTELQTIPLRPVTSRELVVLLEEAGFASVTLYGSIAMTDFDPDSSRDLVVLASRS